MAKTSMFTRARLQLPLTPSERSLLKALQTMAFSAIVAGVVAVLPFLEGQQVNWLTVIKVAGGAVGVAFFTTLSKYFTAQGDGQLAGAAGAIAQAFPTSAPVSPPVASPAANLTVPTGNLNTTATAPVTVTTVTTAPVSNI